MTQTEKLDEKPPTRGLFISFEGIDGTGKTTQLQLLQKRLEKRGHKVRRAREPSDNVIGKMCRSPHLNITEQTTHFYELPHWAAHFEACLFMADRIQNFYIANNMALLDGTHVLTDRFLDSTFAYQGAKLSQSENWQTEFGWLTELAKKTIPDTKTGNAFEPDITFLLLSPVEQALQRAKNRNNQRQEAHSWFEELGTAYLKRVEKIYLEIQQQAPHRVQLIENASIKDTEEQIWNILSQKFAIATQDQT